VGAGLLGGVVNLLGVERDDAVRLTAGLGPMLGTLSVDLKSGVSDGRSLNGAPLFRLTTVSLVAATQLEWRVWAYLRRASR
jgi:hypothetical protein